MERYVTFTELKQNLREVKDAACEDVVHVLHHGKPGYVLCSFEVWERRMAAARRRGAYRANVEESLHESEWDEERGRLVDAADVLALGDDLKGRPCISESALHYLDLEYDGEQRLLLGQMLAELSRRPDMGKPLEIEYDGENLHARKFFCPPCDVLYTEQSQGGILVRGFVRALEWEEQA